MNNLIFCLKTFKEYFDELNSLKINELLNLFCFIITIIAAIYSVIIFSKTQFKKSRYKKEERFLSRYKRISKLSSEFSNNMFKYYYNKYKDDVSMDETSGIIIHKDWYMDFNGTLMEDVNIVSCNGDINPENSRLSLSRFQKIRNNMIKTKLRKRYPQKRNGYALNIIQYVDGKNLFNGELFAASDIKIDKNKDKPVTIEVYLTDYFSFVDSCKALEFKYSLKKQNRSPDIDIFDFTNRSAGIGVNCLTIFPNILTGIDDDGNKIYNDYVIFHKRNSNVIESPHTIHVVPAGSYQPIKSIIPNKGLEFNKNLANTVYREFCEEILHTNHMSELVSIDLLNISSDYADTKKYSKIYYLGIGLEPFNTKVEVLGLMVYKSPKIVNITDLKKFLSIDSNDDEFNDNEGKIILEKFQKPLFEQYWGTKNITPSSKEIFKQVYQNFEYIKDLIHKE